MTPQQNQAVAVHGGSGGVVEGERRYLVHQGILPEPEDHHEASIPRAERREEVLQRDGDRGRASQKTFGLEIPLVLVWSLPVWHELVCTGVVYRRGLNRSTEVNTVLV